MQREAKRREDERVISEARLRRSSPRRRSVEDQVWEAGGDNVNFGAKKPTSYLGFPLDVRKSSGS